MGSAYFFNGSKYVRVDGILPGQDTDKTAVGPASISSGWKSIAAAGFDSVDAVLKMSNGVAYFFSGDHYIRVDGIRVGENSDNLAVKPTPIHSNWRSIKEAGFDIIDAVLPMGDGVAYFFSGNKYIRVSSIAVGKNTDILDVKPTEIVNGWPSLKEAGFKSIVAVLSIGDSDAYFFSGSQYVRVKDIVIGKGGDKMVNKVYEVTDNWPSLKNFW